MGMKVLVTGANGFVGNCLCRELIEQGFTVRAAVRSAEKTALLPKEVESCIVGEVGPDTDWSVALDGVDSIVHLAGLAHTIKDKSIDSLQEYRRINSVGTEHLAKIAVQYGVRRLIFVSSIKVNGEYTSTGSSGKMQRFKEESAPSPQDYYAVSKWEAEQSLRKIEKDSGVEVVILRLPLIYGPAVKANFLSLLKLVDSNMPLPLAALKNCRSFLYLGNLVDIIITCMGHPLAAGETFLVSDCQDVSTPDLIKMIAFAMNKKPILFSLHPIILKTLCKILRKTEELEKLTGTLLVDSSKIRNLLGWKPKFTMEEGIRKTVK